MPGLRIAGADPRPMLAHETGPGHPERAERLAAVHAALRRRFPEPARWIEARPAGAGLLGLVHDESYVARVLATAGRSGWLDPDTPFGPASAEAARHAVGCAVAAVRAVLDASADSALAPVRPPGHHAERDRASGFCLFDNAAIAIADALASGRARRVFVLDWDVHHGNGVQNAFRSDPRVLHVDLHQHPLFPGTGLPNEIGDGPGRGLSVNVALPAGRQDGDYLAVLDDLVAPALAAFDPDLVVICAGFDAHAADPLGGMNLTTAGFAALAGRALRWAQASGARGPVAILEGGYDLRALADSVTAVAAVLDGGPVPRLDPAADPATLRAIAATRAAHAPAGGPVSAG